MRSDDIRAAVVAACRERGWCAARLAREAHVSPGTGLRVFSDRPIMQGTLARLAEAVGVDAPGLLPPDDPRDTSAVGVQCQPSAVDLPALRYVLRQLVDVERMPPAGRALVAEAGRYAGLPRGWERRALWEFEA